MRKQLSNNYQLLSIIRNNNAKQNRVVNNVKKWEWY